MNMPIIVHDGNGNLSTCIGINEHPELDFTVYPNPNQGFYIRNNGQTNDFILEVVDLEGRLVYKKARSMSGASELNIALDVEAGTYFLSVSNKRGKSVYKVIVH